MNKKLIKISKFFTDRQNASRKASQNYNHPKQCAIVLAFRNSNSLEQIRDRIMLNHG